MRQWPAGCKRLLGGESERKIGDMTKAAEAVLADALRLDLDARAEIAAELLASLDGPLHGKLKSSDAPPRSRPGP